MLILSKGTDTPAAQAKQHNDAALAADATAKVNRAQRDIIIRTLRKQEPTVWTYGALSKSVGISVYAVTKIIKTTVALPR